MENFISSLKYYLINPIKMKVDRKNLDFTTAKEIADKKVKGLSSDSILLAWYIGKTGEHFPRVECHSEYKPAWIIYAKIRGNDITIDINEEEYVFIYQSQPS